MTKPNTGWLTLSIMACALGVGCGGSQAAAPAASTANEVHERGNSQDGPVNAVTKHGSGKVQAHFGKGGGTLELEEGPRVTVPAGEVDGAQDFVLELAPKTTAFSNKESERALGPTFSFSPPLDGNIEVSFPLASLPAGWGDPSIAYEVAEGEAIQYGEDSTRTKWQYERAQYSGGRLTAHLSEATGLRMQFVLTNLESQ
jgi:hypothetical protein